MFLATQCPAGTFSVGGGTRLEDFATWPLEWDVETYCAKQGEFTTYLDCGWTVGEDPDTIYSGHINDSMSTSLEIRALFVRPGTIRFSYKVDAEPRYDGLTFWVDNVKRMNLTSNTNGFELFTFDVTSGYHRFKWVYEKDFAVAEGEDRAALRMIEFEGTAWGDDECTPCPAGHYSRPGSVDCTPCPANTFAADPGTPVCTACPAGTYAYEESESCTLKPPCTVDDYASFVTPCVGNSRTRSYNWTEPQICDPLLPESVTLPPPANVNCAHCPGGTTANNGQCVPCADGFARPHDQEQCAPCPAGTAAIKSQHFYSWEAWNEPFFSTFCEGECGTTGWRLLSEYIDSGVGHGHSVSSILRLSISLAVRGSLSFNASMRCEPDSCSLEVEDVGYSAWSFGSTFNGVPPNALQLPPGDHTILFKFEKYDPHRSNRNDRVLFYNINVDGTTTGGSRGCVTCAGGTAAGAQQAMCTNCTAGTYAPPGAAQCLPCAMDYFSDTDGASACIPCGANSVIHTPPGSTECLYDCRFDNGAFHFDLRNLSSATDMWGPVYDERDHAYMFNPCSTSHQNHSCFDRNGDPIKTFVCQVTNIGLGMDLGSVIGYAPLPAPARPQDGLLVQYTHGTAGCAATQPDRKPRPRTTSIKFLCDPDAGVGLAEQPSESSPCTYTFEWRSHYACPLCSEADWAFVLSPCDPVRQTRRMIYYWISNPRRCHDGLSLPPSTQVACTPASTVQCPAGSYLSPNGSTCITTAPGFYSSGASDNWLTWSVESLGQSVESPWNTSCSGQGCVPWTVTADGQLKSGSGFSTLTAVVTWERSRVGAVAFSYKFGHSNNSQFDVLFNGAHKWDLERDPVRSAGTMTAEWSEVTISGVIGTQIITFNFLQEDPLDFVIIRSVAFVNVRSSAGFPSPCAPGYFAAAPGAAGCTICPQNTYSERASSNCTHCANDEYSLPGSEECTPRPECTEADWQISWTACVGGSRNGTYQLVPPAICQGGVRAPSPVYYEDCQPCPAGSMTIAPGACGPCAAGQYFDTATSRCTSIPSGHVSIPALTMWTASASSSLPPGWKVNCTGNCPGAGWRARGYYADSGVSLGAEIDSKLHYHFEMLMAGTLEFDYFFSPTQPVGSSLVVLVDGISTDLIPRPSVVHGFTVPVPATATRIDFVHHLMPNSPPAIIGNVTLTGVKDGFARFPTPCPPGTESSGTNPVCQPCRPGSYSPTSASSCILCPPNTFSNAPGTIECTKCGTGTESAEGSRWCLTPLNRCRFASVQHNETYDLSWVRRSIITPDGNRGAENMRLSICEPLLNCNDNDLFTFGCLSNSVNIGRRMSFIDGSSPGAFTLKYDMGDLCNNQAISTTINFRCVNESNRLPKLITNINQPCTIAHELTWETVGACRICGPSDYEQTASPCVGGRHEIALVLRPSVICNGPERLSSVEASCTEEVPMRPWYLLVAVALLLVLVLIIVFVVMRNRSLEHRYTQLAAVRASNNAPDVADTIPVVDTPPGNGAAAAETDDL